jgi:DNA-binding transcriptional regulator PaaX
MEMKLVPTTIIEFLDKNGATSFNNLFKITKKRHVGINEQTFNITLMRMEIQGFLKVYQLPKGKKRIERA